jgi:hypothetical protein
MNNREEEAASGETGGQGEDDAAGGSRYCHRNLSNPVLQAEAIAAAAWATSARQWEDLLRRDRELALDIVRFLRDIIDSRAVSAPMAALYAQNAWVCLLLGALLAEADAEERDADAGVSR